MTVCRTICNFLIIIIVSKHFMCVNCECQHEMSSAKSICPIGKYGKWYSNWVVHLHWSNKYCLSYADILLFIYRRLKNYQNKIRRQCCVVTHLHIRYQKWTEQKNSEHCLKNSFIIWLMMQNPYMFEINLPKSNNGEYNFSPNSK